MKKLFYIIVLFAVFGCKTKTVTVDKSSELEKFIFQKHFDSLVQLQLKWQLDYSRNQSLVNSNWVLKSTPVLDSLGNRKPLNYKHYVHGKLAEEIFLEGGELSQSNETKQLNESEHKDENKVEKGRFESDVGVKADAEKATKKKAKEAETKGFQAGFWIWLFGIVIALALVILWWISKRLKLPDKLKDLFGNKGG